MLPNKSVNVTAVTKELEINNSSVFRSWFQGIIPFSVEIGGCYFERGHLLIGDLDSFGIVSGVQGGLDAEPSLRGGIGNQVYDHRVARQGLAAPVLGDPTKHAMFDLIPLAGSRRKVTDTDLQIDLIRQLLQCVLPQPVAARIAATPIGGDQ